MTDFEDQVLVFGVQHFRNIIRIVFYAWFALKWGVTCLCLSIFWESQNFGMAPGSHFQKIASRKAKIGSVTVKRIFSWSIDRLSTFRLSFPLPRRKNRNFPHPTFMNTSCYQWSTKTLNEETWAKSWIISFCINVSTNTMAIFSMTECSKYKKEKCYN